MTELSISIVTPTLNAARFLPQCLDSLRSQAWPGLEHLVVDGGSTDRTSELVLASDAVWMTRAGLKQTAAINVGLRAARGEVVAWLNADDLYTPGAVGYVARCFAAQPDLDVLIGDCQVIDAEGAPLWYMRPGPYDFGRLLRTGNSVPQPAVFLRKRVFDEIGYLDESLDFGMDYDLWLRLNGRQVAYVPRALAAFRWHSDSKTANNLEPNWRELLRIVRRYGGDWTPALVWSYARARVTLARQRLAGRVWR